MKIKKLFVFSVFALSLVACGANTSSIANTSTDSTSTPSTSSITSLVSSSEDSKPVSSSTTSSSSPVSTSSETTSSDIQVATYNITVTCSEGITCDLSANKAAYGEQITLTVSLNSGYILKSITLNGNSISLAADSTYTFTMPRQDVTIVANASLGYGVTFTSNHASGKLATTQTLFAYDDIVEIVSSGADEGYFFSHFNVTDKSGNAVTCEYDDDLEVYYFAMPTGGANVEAVGELVPEAVKAFAGTYENGVQIDSNVICTEFKLVIGYDYSVKFYTDWQDPLFYGTYTIDGNKLTSDLNHQGSTYHFEMNFTRENNFIECKFYYSNTSFDYYLFARDNQNMEVKNVYTNYVTSGKRNKLYEISYTSGTFYTYVSAQEDVCYYYLRALEDGVTTPATSLVANKIYSLVDSSNTEMLVVKFDGTNISASGVERGTYKCAGSADLILDGFNKYTWGDKQGNYVYRASENGVVLTVDGEAKFVNLDITNKTYVLDVVADDSDPFVNHSFKGSFTAWDDDYANSYSYDYTLIFSSTPGIISSIGISCDAWCPPYSNSSYTDCSYEFDNDTLTLTIQYNGNKTITMTSNSTYTQLKTTSTYSYISETKNVILKRQ